MRMKFDILKLDFYEEVSMLEIVEIIFYGILIITVTNCEDVAKTMQQSTDDLQNIPF
jgi:hypothetical protein